MLNKGAEVSIAIPKVGGKARQVPGGPSMGLGQWEGQVRPVPKKLPMADQIASGAGKMKPGARPSSGNPDELLRAIRRMMGGGDGRDRADLLKPANPLLGMGNMRPAPRPNMMNNIEIPESVQGNLDDLLRQSDAPQIPRSGGLLDMLRGR